VEVLKLSPMFKIMSKLEHIDRKNCFERMKTEFAVKEIRKRRSGKNIKKCTA